MRILSETELFLTVSAAAFVSGMAIAYTVEQWLRLRHGLVPAHLFGAWVRGIAGTCLLWPAGGCAGTAAFHAARGLPQFVAYAATFALMHLIVAGTVYFSFIRLRATPEVPRWEVLLASAVGSFVWLAGLWGAAAVIGWAS